MDSKPINFPIYLFVVHFENIIQRFIQRCVSKYYTNIMYDRYYKFKIELLIYLPNYFMFQVIMLEIISWSYLALVERF